MLEILFQALREILPEMVEIPVVQNERNSIGGIMEEIRIVEDWNRKECFNPISDHRWTEQTTLKGYLVRGGGCFTTFHKTLKGAEKEVKIRKPLFEKLKKLYAGESIE